MKQLTTSIKVRLARWYRVPLLFLFVSVIYVLSFGPAYRLHRKDTVPPWIFYTFYRPLEQATDYCDLFKQFVWWYEGIWYPERPHGHY